MSTKKIKGDENSRRSDQKGQPDQNHQQGGPAMSRRDAGKHEKDESGGAEKNTTKKHSNSI